MAGEFEGKSLDALYAMIASAKPEEITSTGTALASAVPKILEIAADLRLYISRVQWEGEGGNAFRKWGAGMVSETLVLGDFTKVVADELQRAGQALSEAKAAVPKPAGMCFADAEKEKARIESETGPKLQEAIHQLERLSSYYDATRNRIGAEREPDFKALPGTVAGGEHAYGTGGTGGGTTYASTSGAGASPADRSSTRTPDAATPSQPTPDVTLPPTATRPPESEVNTNLDSVTITPDVPTRPTLQPPTTPPVTTVGPPTPPLPPLAPPVGPQPTTGPPRANPGLPGPATGGLKAPSPLGTPPRAEGITGGRQVPGRTGLPGQGPRLPMGPVIGEERAGQYGRGGAGMHGPGAGMHGAPGGNTGGAAGRRLAMQPGGTVGTPTGSAGRAFTPGGTGLVRPASTERGEDERRTNRSRPDYLTEDEETWDSGQRQIVPPVID
ncbi:WXG100 family type VII secretion target [Streptomyces sp. NPDC013457]|uniref:WXG100 family type VII secretion target n=1 Tax=Streptomyces sp. NPDC013457 TaxID=3364866 RepID=UPI003702A9DD